MRSVILPIMILCSVSCMSMSNQRNKGAAGTPGGRGEKGELGEKGDRGLAGKTCVSEAAEGGIILKCQGSDPAFIPNGQAGLSGKDGKGCFVKSQDATSTTVSCPSAGDPAVYVDTKISQGTSGVGCTVVSRAGGSTELKCGNDTFVVKDGLAGGVGERGDSGVTFTTNLSKPRIEQARTGALALLCSIDYTTTDADFSSRYLRVEIWNGDQYFLPSVIKRVADFTRTNNTLTFEKKSYRDFLKGGEALRCRFSLFMDQSAIAFVTKTEDSDIVEAVKDKLLPLASDLKPTVVVKDGAKEVELHFDNTIFSDAGTCKYFVASPNVATARTYTFNLNQIPASISVSFKDTLSMSCPGDNGSYSVNMNIP